MSPRKFSAEDPAPSMTPPPSAGGQQFTLMARKSRNDTFRDALLWILIGALAIASLTFLVSVNSIISIWFREQWAPIARATVALLVILVCLFGLMKIVRRGAPDTP